MIVNGLLSFWYTEEHTVGCWMPEDFQSHWLKEPKLIRAYFAGRS